MNFTRRKKKRKPTITARGIEIYIHTHSACVTFSSSPYSTWPMKINNEKEIKICINTPNKRIKDKTTTNQRHRKQQQQQNK